MLIVFVSILFQAYDVVAELTDGRAVGDEDHCLVVTVLEETAEEFVLGLFVK